MSNPMIMKPQLLFLAGLFSLCYSAFAVEISDDFNGETINSALWDVSLPFSTSQVYEAGGNAVLISRGGLNTVASFPDAVDIQGRFEFAASSDHFRVVFRSDLAFNSATMEKSG